MPASYYLYRIGYELLTPPPTKHRCIWSETWLSESDEVSRSATRGDLSAVAVASLQNPWATFDLNLIVFGPQFFCQRLWPFDGNWYFPPNHTPGGFRSSLNPAAPEACFRLQRVGASDGGEKLGRILFPILWDHYYTDLPHRRHVNVAPLQAYLDAAPFTNSIVPFGSSRTYKRVIFHRATMTWTLVTSLRLLENPIRKWQRYAVYNHTPFPARDAKFYPQEVTWF